VADEAQVETLFANVHKDFGSVDGLVNNAGTNRDALLVKADNGKIQSKMSLEDFNKVIGVDLVGVSTIPLTPCVAARRSRARRLTAIVSTSP
jgi:3-oxoacyl-[acyl-carrier protein] reductase